MSANAHRPVPHDDTRALARGDGGRYRTDDTEEIGIRTAKRSRKSCREEVLVRDPDRVLLYRIGADRTERHSVLAKLGFGGYQAIDVIAYDPAAVRVDEEYIVHMLAGINAADTFLPVPAAIAGVVHATIVAGSPASLRRHKMCAEHLLAGDELSPRAAVVFAEAHAGIIGTRGASIGRHGNEP